MEADWTASVTRRLMWDHQEYGLFGINLQRSLSLSNSLFVDHQGAVGNVHDPSNLPKDMEAFIPDAPPLENAEQIYKAVVGMVAQESAEVYRKNNREDREPSAPTMCASLQFTDASQFLTSLPLRGLNGSGNVSQIAVASVSAEWLKQQPAGGFIELTSSSCQSHDQKQSSCPQLAMLAAASTLLVLPSGVPVVRSKDVRAPLKGALCVFTTTKGSEYNINITGLRGTQRGKHQPVGLIRAHGSNNHQFYLTLQQSLVKWEVDVSVSFHEDPAAPCCFSFSVPVASDSKSKKNARDTEPVAEPLDLDCICMQPQPLPPLEANILLDSSPSLQIPIQRSIITVPLRYWSEKLPHDSVPPQRFLLHFLGSNRSRCIVHDIQDNWLSASNALWRPGEDLFWHVSLPDGIHILNRLFPGCATSERRRFDALTQLSEFTDAKLTFETYSPSRGNRLVQCKFAIALSARAGYPPPPPDVDIDPSVDNPLLGIFQRALWHGLLANKPLHAFAGTPCVGTIETLLQYGFDPYCLLEPGSAITPLSIAMLEAPEVAVALASAAERNLEKFVCSLLPNDMLTIILSYLLFGDSESLSSFGKFCLSQRRTQYMIVSSRDAYRIRAAAKTAPLPLLLSTQFLTENMIKQTIEQAGRPELKLNTRDYGCWLVEHLRDAAPDVLTGLLEFLPLSAQNRPLWDTLSSQLKKVVDVDRARFVGRLSESDTFYLFDFLEPAPCSDEMCPLRGLKCRNPFHCFRLVPIHLPRGPDELLHSIKRLQVAAAMGQYVGNIPRGIPRGPKRSQVAESTDQYMGNIPPGIPEKWSRVESQAENDSGFNEKDLYITRKLPSHNIHICQYQNRQVVVKYRCFAREASFMQKLKHSNIIGYVGQFSDNLSSAVSIVTEFAPNQSLSKLLREQSEMIWKRREVIARDICSALVYLHSREDPLIHADVHAGNIVFDENFNPKLIDFDISRTESEESNLFGRNRLITPTGEQVSKATDIYAFGLVLCRIFTANKSPVETSWAQLIQDCCSLDPTKRPTADVLHQRICALIDHGGA